MSEEFKCRECGLKKTECSAEDISICVDCGGDYASCVECKEDFIQDRDLQICDKCIKLFDLDKLWKLHDKNKIDCLDFNESKKFREQFRIKGVV